jgi:futalosine hydrolase
VQTPRPSRRLDARRDGRPALVAVAAPVEAEAVLAGLGCVGSPALRPWEPVPVGERLHVVLTGVGKANAAGAAAAALSTGRYGALCVVGLAGALPVPSPARVGQTVLAEACILADDGIELAEGYRSQGELGFPAHETHGQTLPADGVLLSALAPLADRTGACATVSSASGTDARARLLAERTGALVEDMESAAAALACARLGVPFACVRVVSNRTGERSGQGWDLPGALGALRRLASGL